VLNALVHVLLLTYVIPTAKNWAIRAGNVMASLIIAVVFLIEMNRELFF